MNQDESFSSFIKTAKEEIENASVQYFNQIESSAPNSPLVQSSLHELIRQHEGGKRIRGALVKLGEMIASRGTANNYLPIAVGYEVFQTSILIHDDIIDQSDTRRGKPTIHAQTASTKSQHFGISDALCTGIYGYFIAYEFMMQNTDNPHLLKALDLFTRIAKATSEGEIMDVKLPYQDMSIDDDYNEYVQSVNQINEYKTALYTLVGPIMLGAVCGGATENGALVNLLKKAMLPLGMAFQLKDDLLGIYANEAALGKSVLSDIREGKCTLLYGYAYKNSDNNQKALLREHYGKSDASDHDLSIIREIFRSTGARSHTERQIQELSRQSRSLIKNDLIDKQYQTILHGLIDYLVDRKF
jgi:geranylgeranyl diphosphate synthase type I